MALVLKRFILWDYRRASWQYDVMVGLILAFIFLTPRAWFRDQPRIPTASSITALSSEHGSSVLFVSTELLAGIPESQYSAKLTEVLRSRMNNRQLVVTHIDPLLNSEGEVQGYHVFVRP